MRPSRSVLWLALAGSWELGPHCEQQVRRTRSKEQVRRPRGQHRRNDATGAERGEDAERHPVADRKHDPSDPEAIRANFQKLQVGCSFGGGIREPLGRFLRMIFNPIFAEDVLGMRQHFVTLARLRAALRGE